jgi:hypothetical protein
MGEKGLDFHLAHLGRVAQAVEADEGAALMHVDLFGAQAVVHEPDALAQLVEQSDGAQGRQRSRRCAWARARGGEGNDVGLHAGLRGKMPRR